MAPGAPRLPVGGPMSAHVTQCLEPKRKKIKSRSLEGPGGPDLVPTAPHWPAWVGLMVTTHFDLVLGPFWVPPGAQKGPILAQISMAPYLLWYCMVLHRLHSVVQLIWRAGELPRSASSHFFSEAVQLV